MKKFLAVYIGTEAAMERWHKLDEKAQKKLEQEGIAAWHAWMEKHKESLVDMGSPLGTTKRIGPKGIEDCSNALSGFTIVYAESHEAAAQLFVDHPHFSVFPGDSVELMECMPIPG